MVNCNVPSKGANKTTMTTNQTTTATEGRDLILTRIIDAPREKVFRAWTDPALLKQWFAPVDRA